MGSVKILSVEAKDIYGEMHQVGRDPGECEYNIRYEDGTLNLRKFQAVWDYSLDYIKLSEVYTPTTQRNDFLFRVGRRNYTKQIICVTFNYAYKEFNLCGKETYIRNGYVRRECELEDGVCVRDGRLIAIQLNVPVEKPVDDKLLEGIFSYQDQKYVLTGDIPTLQDKASLREHLYKNGFRCDGIEYVRYKRSSGSSRVGKCLFINKELYPVMAEWDRCGIPMYEGDDIDLAAWEAYIALSASSIIDTIEIPLESVLVIDDRTSVFEDDVVAVEIENDHLVASDKKVQIENKLFDGQSLMDKSLFGKYEDKGMLLLRNRFFKSCCFNTNLQQWFADNHICCVEQLNGFTLASSISQIKLVTTASSIKYTKFGSIRNWMNNVDSTFGVVKYEKRPHFFDGRLVQSHYQLLNTLQLSYREIEEFLRPSLEFISAVRSDPAVLRYAIKYPLDDRQVVSSTRPLLNKNEIVFKMLGINDKFAETKLYQDFRDDLVRSLIRNLKRGHVLISGNYSTLFGNGMEMLKEAIGEYEEGSTLGVGEIHSTRFGYGQRLLCSRSPHICSGNLFLATNVESEDYDRYFNLTPEIVCVNAVGDNIQQRLNGCDYDSDTMLITDHPLLIEVAERHQADFKVPTNMTVSVKRHRVYDDADKADLDVRTSVNKIGDIVNLSQQLNSLMWERINKGESVESCQDLYLDICKLAVLSNVEIDRAKKEFVINSTTELNLIKQKHKLEDDEKTVKPMFFKTITTENGYRLSDTIRYRRFKTAMDYLQGVIGKFNFRQGREKKKTVQPLMSIVKPPVANISSGKHYSTKNSIVETIRDAKLETKRLYCGYDNMTPFEKEIVRKCADDIREDCVAQVAELSPHPAAMYLTLKEIDNPEYSDVARYVFDILFSKPDTTFFSMIEESKEPIDELIESDDGDIVFYGFRFKKASPNFPDFGKK